MRGKPATTLLFAVAAAYDGAIGLALLFAMASVLGWFGVALPNHPGYLQFPAALMLVFAAMFVQVARDPFRNRILIPYGILLKVSYCAVAFFHWFAGELPSVWKLLAVIDLVFLPLLVWAYSDLGKESSRAHASLTSGATT